MDTEWCRAPGGDDDGDDDQEDGEDEGHKPFPVKFRGTVPPGGEGEGRGGGWVVKGSGQKGPVKSTALRRASNEGSTRFKGERTSLLHIFCTTSVMSARSGSQLTSINRG